MRRGTDVRRGAARSIRRGSGALPGLAVAAATCLAAGACGDRGERSWSGTLEDSAGVTLALNVREPLWRPEERWTLEETLRIGRVDGDPAYMFGQIVGIGVTSDGRLHVLDQQAQELRTFSPEGTHLRTAGGPGSGPGEFGPQAGPVLVGAGDTLYVPDISNARVNRYAPDGSKLGSYRLSLDQGVPTRWEARPSGEIVNQVRPLGLPNQPEPDSMDAIVVRGREGEALDTLLKLRSGETFSFQSGRPEFHFFTAEPTWALAARGRLLFGVNDEYSIRRIDPAGRLERVIRMPFERAPVTEADADAFRGALERVWTDAGVPDQGIRTLLEGVHFAESFPAYLQFLAGPEETIWVQHVAAPATLSPEERENYNPLLSIGGAEWDVFDAEGRFLGVVSMANRYQPLLFRGDRVYGVWRDELDVQYVRGFAIRRPGTGSGERASGDRSGPDRSPGDSPAGG